MSVKWIILGAFILTFAFSCSKESSQVVELRHFPITSLEEIITQTGVEFDEQVTSDGNGSLKITATDSVVIQLFEVNDIDIEDARLLYRAQIISKTKASFSREIYRHPPQGQKTGQLKRPFSF